MYVGIVYADIYINRIDFLQNLSDMVADAAGIFQIVRIIGGNLGLDLIECLERIGQQLGILGHVLLAEAVLELLQIGDQSFQCITGHRLCIALAVLSLLDHVRTIVHRTGADRVPVAQIDNIQSAKDRGAEIILGDVHTGCSLFEDVFTVGLALNRGADHLLALVHIASQNAPLVIAHAQNRVVGTEIEHEVGDGRVLAGLCADGGEFSLIAVNNTVARRGREELLYLPCRQRLAVLVIDRVTLIGCQIHGILDQPAHCTVLTVVGVGRLVVGENDLGTGGTDDLSQVVAQHIDAVNTVCAGFRVTQQRLLERN